MSKYARITPLAAALALAAVATAYAAPPVAAPSPPVVQVAPPDPAVRAPVHPGAAAVPVAGTVNRLTTPPVPPSALTGANAAAASIDTGDSDFLHHRDALAKENDLLKLEVQNAELRKKLRVANTPGLATAPTQPVAASIISAPPRAMTPVTSVTIPAGKHHDAPKAPPEHPITVASIVEFNGQAEATIIDGSLPVTATAGTLLPSGWRVEAIGQQEVTLRRGRATRHIPVGN